MSGWQKKKGRGGGLEEEEGGILCPNTGPTQHMFIIGIPGQALFFLPDSNLRKISIKLYTATGRTGLRVCLIAAGTLCKNRLHC